MKGTLICAVVITAAAGVARAEDVPPIGMAISKDDTAEVVRLLDAGTDPDTTYNGITMLTWAAGTGKLPMVKLLIDRHATVDPPTKDGFTPLEAALENHHPDIVAYLVTHGAKVNVQRANGYTALDVADANHDAKSAKVIRAHGGVSGLPPLFGAANRGDAATVKKLLASGADVDTRDKLDYTPLGTAANVGSLAVVKVLVEHHATIDAVSNAGWTPLMEASQNDHADVVEYLIAHGAKLDLRNSDGQTALMIAEKSKKDSAAKVLRDHNASDAPPPAPAPAAPAPPSDADCADYRRIADMGPDGFSSLVGGPPDELTHAQPATMRFGESTCTVSEDNRTLLCVWKDDAKDYGDISWFITACSAGNKVETEAGKTIVWWGGVPAKTLIKVYVSDTDLALKFFGGGT